MQIHFTLSKGDITEEEVWANSICSHVEKSKFTCDDVFAGFPSFYTPGFESSILEREGGTETGLSKIGLLDS